ncbi:hypothetical protein DFH29DRAFT_140214 [Suillus ampliporus]|nr:hypothetical protein DFH29DRAFT_140214 [Suillus ampliporus]
MQGLDFLPLFFLAVDKFAHAWKICCTVKVSRILSAPISKVGLECKRRTCIISSQVPPSHHRQAWLHSDESWHLPAEYSGSPKFRSSHINFVVHVWHKFMSIRLKSESPGIRRGHAPS